MNATIQQQQADTTATAVVRRRHLRSKEHAMTTEDTDQPPTDEPSLTEIDQLHRRALDVHAQLPDLFYYATFRADSHPTEAGYDQWTRVRSLAGDLTGALNAVFGIPTEPAPEPEIQERSPAEAFRELLPQLPRLVTIAHHAAPNGRSSDAQFCWVKTHTYLIFLQDAIHAALQAEKLDDALEGRGPDE